jgi:peptidyl-prolyl cis-trans isomerase C/peptidyl-prolyl cis-trans isomerase D
MKLLGLLIAAFLTSFLAFAQNKDVAVATVGAKKITLEEFNKRYNDIRAQTLNPPSRAQFLEDLVRYEVGLQEAEKKKIANDPLVQERVRQEIYKALLEKELGDRVQKISVSDKEMKDFYAKNPEIRFSHILIGTKPEANKEQREEARKRANEIFEEVKKSKRPFEELVRLYSDDPLSKQSGGDVGWQSRVSVVPNVYETLLKMKDGEVKGIIETQFGYHIIKASGRRSYENANKRQLRVAVFDEKRKDVFNNYFDGVKKSYKITINPGAL